MKPFSEFVHCFMQLELSVTTEIKAETILAKCWKLEWAPLGLGHAGAGAFPGVCATPKVAFTEKGFVE